MASLASSLGSALGTGINQLADLKLAELTKKYEQQSERSNFAQSWEPVLGKQTANLLSNLQPQERQYALNNLQGLMQLNQPPSSREQASNLGALSNPQQLQQFAQQQPGKEPQQLNKQQLMQQAIKQHFGHPQSNNEQFFSPQQFQQQPQQQPFQEQEDEMTPERAQLIQDVFFTSPEQRTAKEKLELEKKKLKSKEDLAAWKNTQKYREEILNTEQSSREALQYIKEAQRLEKEGDFPSQAFASFLKGAEWEDVPGFLSGNAEAFNKVLANFQRGVKDVYGGNVSNLEMEQWLKTIPNLYHTPEGRALIFAGMKKYYRGGKERANVEREVIKENGGVPPQDLHEQVNEKFKPIQKELSRSFKRDVEAAKKLASKTSRLGSVAAYGAGKAAGVIPGIIKGGAKGAITGGLAGSVIPGIGTGLGALGGGALGALGGSGGLSDILKLLL